MHVLSLNKKISKCPDKYNHIMELHNFRLFYYFVRNSSPVIIIICINYN